MTDEMLAWQTERLLELETRRDANTVYVRPELVVEVAFDRPDKRPEDADAIETVQVIRPALPSSA